MPAETAAAAPARTHPTPAGACSPPAFALGPPVSASGDGTRLRLTQATRALWTATLALMTAFMQVSAPAHRFLLARRISRNLETLAGQDCFAPDCRERFARLARRWEARAREFSPAQRSAPQPRLRLRLRLRDWLS
jgi:hypothetical protein